MNWIILVIKGKKKMLVMVNEHIILNSYKKYNKIIKLYRFDYKGSNKNKIFI